MGRLSGARAALLVALGAVVTGRASVASAGQQCASGSPPAGVDLNPDSSQPNWVSARSQITFGIIKASQGTTFTASGFATSWAAMKAAGIVRGAYHFFDPTVSGVDQANFFLGIMGPLEAGDLPPTLDIECPTSNNEANSADCLGNGTSGDATGAQITQGMNDWIDTVVAKTGRKPLIYTYGSYFADLGVNTAGLQNYPLWLADYSGTNCFNVPSPWTSATFWQYGDTGSVSGISGAVDQDYFMGTLAQLTAFTAATTPPGDAGTGGSGTGSGSGVDVVPDAGGSLCSLPNGDEGECLAVTVCDALGGTYSPTAGYCPGAANIQCCTGMPATSKHDAGATPDGGSHASGSGDASTGGVTGSSGTGSSAGSGSSGGSPGGSSIATDGGPSSSGAGSGTGLGAVGAPDGGADLGGSFGPSSGGCAVARGLGRSRGEGTRGAWGALLALGIAVGSRRRR